jgi:hypothetical protein
MAGELSSSGSGGPVDQPLADRLAYWSWFFQDANRRQIKRQSAKAMVNSMSYGKTKA